MTPAKTGGAVLYAKDYQRLARFYEGILGLMPVERGNEFIVLEARGFELVLLTTRVSAQVELTDPPTRRAATPIKPVFFVADLAKAREAMAALGGVADPIEKQWQFRGFVVFDGLDPEGNVIQLRSTG